MFSNRSGRTPLFSKLIALGLITLSTGCGILGTANPPKGAGGAPGGNGCLNNSKNLVGRYLAGEISNTEWKSSFACINQSLDFFTSYVRGSVADTYSTEEMHTLVSHFLITNRPVHEELLESAFSLKAALFGGSSHQFTKEEIHLLQSSLTRLSDITGDLIPYLALRKSPNPTPEQLLDMVAAFKRAGDQLADFINTLPVGALSDKALESLINELTVSLDLPAFDDLGGKVFLAKWLMFNTRKDAIEDRDWAQIFRNSLSLGGIMLAYKASIGEDLNAPRHQLSARIQSDYHFREFLWELMQQAKPYIEASLSKHGGFAPFPIYDHIIDALPPEMLDHVPKQYLKDALKPFVRKFLFSSTKLGVDQGVIDTVYDLIGNTIKDFGLLDRFYEQSGINRESVAPLVLNQAMDNYATSLTNEADQVRFKEIKDKIFSYDPLFHKTVRNNKEYQSILFANDNGYSHFQNWMVLGLERAARHLQKAYGSGEGTLVESDIKAFLDDFTDVLFAFKLIDATIPHFGHSRLKDMDLFTPKSNGDGEGSIQELVSYAMIIISTGTLTDRMREEITAKCDQNLGVDLMGWTRLPSQCFRQEFSNRLEYWLDDFPRLKAYWATLGPEDKERASRWLEHGARRDGFTEEDFSKFDIGAMAAVLHYTESLFMRFDFNQDEDLSKSEVDSAYPIFKALIQKTAAEQGSAINGDFLVKGVFTYIVRYRAMPGKSIGELFKLAGWLASYRFTNYSADRLGVFNIVCQLAKPENPNPTAQINVCSP